jgi:hypothetical protein
MPHLDIARPVQSGTAPRRVFISYSHRDIALARAVYETLCMLAGNDPSLNLRRDAIFFDRQALKAGDEWDVGIQEALDRADLFVMLMSRAFFTSDYCESRELARAVELDMPIFPVLLNPVDQWDERPLPGDPQRRKLGSKQAMPIREAVAALEPITSPNWGGEDYALAAVSAQLADALRGKTRAGPVAASDRSGAPARAARGPGMPPALLPALCNQRAAARALEDQLDRWPAERSLLLFVKGDPDDDAPAFASRSAAKELRDWCEADGRPVPQAVPLAFPDHGVLEAGAADPDAVHREWMRAISEAITGSRRELKNVHALADWLQSSSVTQVLQTSIPKLDLADGARALAALGQLLASARAGVPLHQLVICVVVEDSDWVSATGLAGKLGMAQMPAPLHVADLPALQPVTRIDATTWFDLHRRQLEPVLGDRDLWMPDLFGATDTLRHRPFNRKIRELFRAAPRGA